MDSINNQKGKKILALGLGIVMLVGSLALLMWNSAMHNPRLNPIYEPTLMPTQTENSISDNTSTPEMLVDEKPTINILPVELIPSSIFVIEGIEEQGIEGTAQFIANGGTYTLDYSLPQNNIDAHVGLAFAFEQAQNLSDYGYVQMTIDFGWPETSCKFYLKDVYNTSQTASQVSLGHLLSGVEIAVFNLGGQKFTFTIPLKENFSDADFSVISEVGFSLETPYAHGDKEITFSEIRFISQ
jgi:hypothetical protein